MTMWEELKSKLTKIDKNPYLLSFSPADALKMMETIENDPFLYKVTDIKDNVYYCEPSSLRGYMVYTCPECGRKSHICIEWRFNIGFEYCTKCQNVMWQAKIIREVYKKDEEEHIEPVHVRELL